MDFKIENLNSVTFYYYNPNELKQCTKLVYGETYGEVTDKCRKWFRKSMPEGTELWSIVITPVII